MFENKWENQIEQITQLINEAKEFRIDDEMRSYLISYPYFINYFANIKSDSIEIDNLVIGIHFVYGWMPTIFKFKQFQKQDFSAAIIVLNNARNGELLKKSDYEILKNIFNSSLVGSSKLLHFINPHRYAIWDSRVHNYLKRSNISYKFSYKIGDISNYENYLKYLSEISNSDEFIKIYDPVNEKIETIFNYKISKYRAIELLMFKNGKK